MIRRSRPGDEAALHHLWKVAFGDDDDYIDGFFSRLYRPGDAVLWAEGDTVASAIYLLNAGHTTLPDGRDLPTAYAYALATLPEHRGRGLGANVVRACIDMSFQDGFGLNVICPAEESLFPYYENLGYSRGMSLSEGEIHFDTSRNRIVTNQVMSTDFSAYCQLRNGKIPQFSTKYPTEYLRHVEANAQEAGGGLYRLTVGGQVGCAAVERQDNRLLIKEILLPEPLVGQGVQALLAHLGAQTATFRTPTGQSESTGSHPRPFALMALPDGENGNTNNGYFPFVLD